jgi:hypothetical protein
MPLTFQERDFLAVFIYEATTNPFKGPATESLHGRDIYYTDLAHLLTSYYRENPPDQIGFGGTNHRNAPPCPWLDRESAIGRDREIEQEQKMAAHQTVP